MTISKDAEENNTISRPKTTEKHLSFSTEARDGAFARDQKFRNTTVCNWEQHFLGTMQINLFSIFQFQVKIFCDSITKKAMQTTMKKL